MFPNMGGRFLVTRAQLHQRRLSDGITINWTMRSRDRKCGVGRRRDKIPLAVKKFRSLCCYSASNCDFSVSGLCSAVIPIKLDWNLPQAATRFSVWARSSFAYMRVTFNMLLFVMKLVYSLCLTYCFQGLPRNKGENIQEYSMSELKRKLTHWLHVV